MLEIYCRLSVQSERLEHLQLEIQSQEHKLEDTDSVKRKLAVSCRTCSLVPVASFPGSPLRAWERGYRT